MIIEMVKLNRLPSGISGKTKSGALGMKVRLSSSTVLAPTDGEAWRVDGVSPPKDGASCALFTIPVQARSHGLLTTSEKRSYFVVPGEIRAWKFVLKRSTNARVFESSGESGSLNRTLRTAHVRAYHA